MDEQILAKLQQLKAEYLSKLPNRIEELELQWAVLSQRFDKQLFKDFHRAAHSLKGSASTYGVTEVSERAKELESYLRILLDSNAITPSQVKAIAELLAKLRSSLSSIKK